MQPSEKTYYFTLFHILISITITTTAFHHSTGTLPVPHRKTFVSTNVFSSSNVDSLTKSTAYKLGDPICSYYESKIPTSQSGPPTQSISVEDLTPKLKSLLLETGMKNGSINIISRHTTTAITINERETRLAKDMETYFLSLAPPDERSSAETAKSGVRYFHNDIDQRPDSAEEAQRCRDNGWNIDDPKELKAWRNQEPINSHSHLLSMLLGSSETIPVVNGEMVIGQWQSVLLVDLDGPRDRTVGIQFNGYL
mmetsp:Transcript_21545/g.24493  ORF Transcript_21545/g.24493 Transcript_21545/m.24493 type:complete len:253 (+) Transcript_21545:198-956(+)